MLSYQDAHLNDTFSGDRLKISSDDTNVLVTATIRETVDFGFRTFTLFVPRVNLVDGQAAHVTTVGVVVVHRSTFLPGQGQLDSYQSFKFSGNASIVEN